VLARVENGRAKTLAENSPVNIAALVDFVEYTLDDIKGSISHRQHPLPGQWPSSIMQKQILGAQKVAEEQSKPLNDNVAKLEREIKSFVTDHRDEMGKTKSVVLTFGEVGFRLSTSVSLPRAKEKLEEIIRRLKSRQMTDCIVVEEKVSKEALKKYGEDTVNAVGATWKQSDVFGYEVNIAKLEQIKAGN